MAFHSEKTSAFHRLSPHTGKMKIKLQLFSNSLIQTTWHHGLFHKDITLSSQEAEIPATKLGNVW